MSQELQQCPRCGAYVLSGDAVCPRCDHALVPVAPDESAPPDPPTATPPVPEEETPPDEHAAAEGSTPPVASEPPDAVPALERDEARPQPPEVSPGPAEEAPAVHEEDSDSVPAPDFTALFPPEEVEAEARLPFQDTDRRAPETVQEDTPTHPAESIAPPVEAPPEPPQDHTQITPSRLVVGPGYIVPPAPYTPPPAVYGLPASAGHVYLQQRVADYALGGYRVHSHAPTQAMLSCGKNLGVGGWMLALITGCFVAGYSMVDGYGARAAGTPVGFYAWETILNAIAFSMIVATASPGTLRKTVRNHKKIMAIGGGASFVAYALVVWAFTQAPIAVVTALRETSIVFALLIGVFFLRERLNLVKLVSAMLTMLTRTPRSGPISRCSTVPPTSRSMTPRPTTSSR